MVSDFMLGGSKAVALGQAGAVWIGARALDSIRGIVAVAARIGVGIG